MTGRRLHAAVFVAAACVLTYAVPAWAHDTGVRRADAAWGPRAASAPQSCPGRAIQPDQVITGDFGTDLQGSYVMLPFDVPQGTTAVRVKDCFDQPEAPVTTPAFSARHTFDLGLLRPPRRPLAYVGSARVPGLGRLLAP